MTRKIIISFLLWLFMVPFTMSQDTIDYSDSYVLYGIVVGNDTILVSSIDEVIIFPKPKFTSRREWRRYYRLVRHIKKVYPIAKAAGEK
ncbi:MAG: DUF4294 domain-containing protein, partial [Bacteroidales bacterium]